MKRVMGWMAVPVLLAACGNSVGSFKGTVGGQSLSVKDAVVLKVSDTSPGNVGGYSLGVLLSDEDHVCDRLKANTRAKNSSFTFIALGSVDANGRVTASVDSGSYPVLSVTALLVAPKSQKLALVGFDRQDSACKSTFTNGNNLGVSGTVTLSSANATSGGSASGSFDVIFQGGDHATGDFNAPFCDFNVNAQASAGPAGVGAVFGTNVTCL